MMVFHSNVTFLTVNVRPLLRALNHIIFCLLFMQSIFYQQRRSITPNKVQKDELLDLTLVSLKIQHMNSLTVNSYMEKPLLWKHPLVFLLTAFIRSPLLQSDVCKSLQMISLKWAESPKSYF